MQITLRDLLLLAAYLAVFWATTLEFNPVMGLGAVGALFILTSGRQSL